MGFRKKLGELLAAGTQLVPVFGPLIAGLIPGTKDDRIIAGVGNTLLEIEGAVADVQQTALTWKDKNITSEDKIRLVTPKVGVIMVRSMKIAGRSLRKEDEAKFLAACGRLGGDYADIMDCFDAD